MNQKALNSPKVSLLRSARPSLNALKMSKMTRSLKSSVMSGRSSPSQGSIYKVRLETVEEGKIETYEDV